MDALSNSNIVYLYNHRQAAACGLYHTIAAACLLINLTIVNGIPFQLIVKLSDCCVFVDINSFNAHAVCPITHLLSRQVIGESCMMCTACQDPCFSTCLKIWFRCPECSCNRKLRHWFFCLLAVYVIDDQTETIAQIDKGCGNSLALFSCKYKSCRIFSVTHG